MSRISRILLVHRLDETLRNTAIFICVIGILAIVIILIAGLSPGKVFLNREKIWYITLPIIWFLGQYLVAGKTSDYWILPEYKQKIQDILSDEGFVLKMEENGTQFFIKKRRFWRWDLVRLSSVLSHLELKVTVGYEKRMDKLISPEMLYGTHSRKVQLNVER